MVIPFLQNNIDGLPPLAHLFAPLADQQRIGLAVSGGADSLALLVLLHAWAQPLGKQLFIYTVDHGLRPEAQDECAYVVQVALEYGLSVQTLVWTGEKPQTGVQAAARAARYALIAEAMAVDAVSVLTTGHHLEDQAETILMRMAHGSGIGGLAGMRLDTPQGDIRLVRPLLDVTKECLKAVVSAAGLRPVHDVSNDSVTYERVRWRRILPLFAQEGLTPDCLARLAKRAQRTDQALGFFEQHFYEAHADLDPFGCVTFARAALLDLPEEIVVRLLQHAIDFVGASAKPFALEGVENQVARLLDKDFLGQVTYGGCVILASSQSIRIWRELSRIEQASHVIAPLGHLLWDDRFEITNLSKNDPVYVAGGQDVSRKMLLEVFGQTFEGQISAARGAPLIRNASGDVIALGRLIALPVVKVVLANNDTKNASLRKL